MKYFLLVLFTFTLNNQATASWESAVAFFDNSDQSLNNEITQHQADILAIQKKKKRNFKLHQKKFIRFEKSEWSRFISDAFKNPQSKKILIIYGHGSAFDGFNQMSISEWEKYLPQVDILWFQSCFMANIETVFQWRNHFQYFIGSQESEFSGGRTMTNLDASLSTDLPAEKMALLLAKQYIVSYSYSAQGLSRFEREETGATIAVIEKEALIHSIQYFQKAWVNIKEKIKTLTEQQNLNQKINIIRKYASMENSKLTDLGLFSYLFGEDDLVDLFSVQQRKRARNILIEQGEISQLMDYLLVTSNDSDNPVKMNAYHLKQSTETIKYTGLSIYNPLTDDQTIQYRNLDFVIQTGWGQ